ncbi:MAG: CapA family protein [Clostridia bacterium]|nr:CapA family protein [Clostridia bacterium]
MNRNVGGQPDRRLRQRRKKQYGGVIFYALIAVIMALILAIAFLLLNGGDEEQGGTGDGTGTLAGNTSEDLTVSSYDTADGTSAEDTTEAVTEVLDDVITYSEATILSVGDIMFHMPQINYAEAAGEDGYYDFSNSFKYISEIVSSADYAVANFETTLTGEDEGYSGYPSFNAPDDSLDAIIDAGFDMMLFANNHCYDKRTSGLLRTQEMFEEYGLSYIGAKESEDDDAYAIAEINGIKVGMINYADDLLGGNTETRTINGIAIRDGDLGLMNLYNLSLLDDFYSEVEDIISEMEDEGVDFIIAYMHWGTEYRITHTTYQETVAQELCELGVDVIIGGHPHVIEDTQILTSEDGTRTTVCFYSLGNFVSNQNRRTLGDTTNSTYTEGGLMVMLTIRKYSTGEVYLADVEEIPTFVHRYLSSNGYYAHEIIPLAAALEDPEAYGLTATSYGVDDATEVYALELEILGDVIKTYSDGIVLPVIEEKTSG